jgi:hypothetical protein
MKLRTTHRLAAILTTGALMSEVGAAEAATFKDMSVNIVTASSGFPGLIQTVAYIGGTALGVAGLFKIKQHVDNPGQTPLKDGLIRLGAGGGLLALPFVTTSMLGSIGTGTQTAPFQLMPPAAVP